MGTHTKAYADDYKVGDNRGVNACNVMPESLVAEQFGKTTPNDNYIQESYMEGNIAVEAFHDGNAKISDVSACDRNLPTTFANDDIKSSGSIALNFDAFNNTENAAAHYSDGLNNDAPYLPEAAKHEYSKLDGIDNTYVAARVAGEFVYLKVVSLVGNYSVRLNIDFGGSVDGQGAPTLSVETMKQKAIAIIKGVRKNVADQSISTHPTTPSLTEPFPGVSAIDACQIFDQSTYKKYLLKPNADLPEYAKTPKPFGIQRKYQADYKSLGLKPSVYTSGPCARQSGIVSYKTGLSFSERVVQDNKAFSDSSSHASVEVDYYSAASYAQHRLDFEASQSGATRVGGIGDGAVSSPQGAQGEFTQFIVQKGSYLVVILENTQKGANLNIHTPVDRYAALAKVLVARLP